MEDERKEKIIRRVNYTRVIADRTTLCVHGGGFHEENGPNWAI